MSSVTFTAEAGRRDALSPLRLPFARVLAIDAFRGLTILLMIFVNALEDVRGMPAWLYHAPDDADVMTLPDLVFPAFLFIVGMSIPFALSQRLATGDGPLELMRHVLARAGGLIVLGVFMVNAESGYDETTMPLSIGLWSLLFYASALTVWGVPQLQNRALAAALRALGAAGLVALALLYRGGEDNGAGLSAQWWGILGLIGWAYLFACAMYLFSRGRAPLLIAAILLALIYDGAAQLDAVQASPILRLLAAQSENAIHATIVLSGVITTLFFFTPSIDRTPQRFGAALALAVALAALGVLLEPYYGVSKAGATPSWALYSAALCVAAFAFLYWLIDLRGARGWTAFLRPAAANPLFIYLLPNMIGAIMKCLRVGLPVPLTHGAGGLIWAAAYAFMMLALAHRMRLKLRL